MNLTLQEIEKASGGKLYNVTDGDRSVSSVVIDSRKIAEGSVFVATPGERVDGHKFISQVYTNGAALAITQKTPEQVSADCGVDCSNWGAYLLVEDSLQALKDIAEYYREKLGIRIVGITGSVGKTSTKEFVASVLGAKYSVLKTEGNFNNEIGVPLTLLRMQQEHEVAVVEMGISDFGEMHRLSKMVKPNVCVMTNIGQCHLENLGTRDGILKAKSEIFDYMQIDGAICLNGDDDKLATIAEVKGVIPMFFGLEDGESETVSKTVIAKNIVSHGLKGSEAVLQIADENGTREVSVQVPLPGRHMVLNAACAACVAQLFDISDEEIVRGLHAIEPVSGRNHILSLEKYTLIDDCYNANPGSMKAAIDLLQMADTEKVAILGDMFELGDNSDELHAGVGAYAAEAGIDRLICIGVNSANMFDAAADAAQGEMQVSYFADRESFLETLRENREDYVPDGATVLIKASHGMEFTKILDFLS